jgi:hypothetical protein
LQAKRVKQCSVVEPELTVEWRSEPSRVFKRKSSKYKDIRFGMGGLVNISHLIATRLRRGRFLAGSPLCAQQAMVLYRNPFGLKRFDLAMPPLRQS